MALFYSLQISLVYELIENNWILMPVSVSFFCNMLFWLKHMKKSLPHIDMYLEKGGIS